MPTLEFKGKQHIYAHHLSVPYRPLVADPEKSVYQNMESAPPPDRMSVLTLRRMRTSLSTATTSTR